MQVNSETKTSSPGVHELVQGRTFRNEENKIGNAPGLGNSRLRRRNGQKKKPSGKRKVNASVRDNGNVGPSTISVDQKAESGREFRQSPLRGVKTFFQGSPRSRSNAEMLGLPMDQTYTRPATPGPSRKNQDKNHGRFKLSPECREITLHQSSRAAFEFSGLSVQEHDATFGQNGLPQQPLLATSNEKLDPARDAEIVTSATRSQKKRRNRRKNKHEKHKRDYIPGENPPGQCSAGQSDLPKAREKSPPLDNVLRTCPPQIANRPPPIPMIKFEVKPDYGLEKLPGPVPNLGQDMGSNIDRSPRKGSAEKSLFPTAGRVVRILQNKNRGRDIGCTQTGNQQMQKSTPQVLSAAKQIHRTTTTENEHQYPRNPSFSGTGRIRGEVPKPHENKTLVGTQFRQESQGPSPGASSPPIRVSSQDVRHDDGAPLRIRRTPGKPRRKPFQKYRGK